MNEWMNVNKWICEWMSEWIIVNDSILMSKHEWMNECIRLNNWTFCE